MTQPRRIRTLSDEIAELWRDAARRVDDRAAEIFAAREGPLRASELRRLRALGEVAQRELRAVEETTRRWLAQEFPQAYASGAATASSQLGLGEFAWSTPHRAAVVQIAGDTYDDLLARSRFVPRNIRSLVADLSRGEVAGAVTTGRTPQQAGRDLRRLMLDRGITHVRYANGARHGVGEYAEMVLRTKTATAYNAGTLNESVHAGITVFEMSDGADCGLTTHEDPDKANGKIVDAHTAGAFPISHPNCRRAITARPDLRAGDVGTVQPLTTEAQRADQAAFERFLAESTGERRLAAAARARRSAARARGRQPRQRRQAA